jgi:hypothetical protein
LQGVLVALGMELGAVQRVIKPHGHDSSADLAVRLQNFIIWCVCRTRCHCDCVQALMLSAPPHAQHRDALLCGGAQLRLLGARVLAGGWAERRAAAALRVGQRVDGI